MRRANPTWGSPRIGDELVKPGLTASTATIGKYRPKSKGKPSPGWRTFLRNHASGIAAMDFFVMPTATFQLLYHRVGLCNDENVGPIAPLPIGEKDALVNEGTGAMRAYHIRRCCMARNVPMPSQKRIGNASCCNIVNLIPWRWSSSSSIGGGGRCRFLDTQECGRRRPVKPAASYATQSAQSNSACASTVFTASSCKPAG